MTFDEKCHNFSLLLEAEASKRGCVWIDESGEGHDKEFDTIFAEDVAGWLIPKNDDIEKGKNDANYRVAVWREENGDVIIDFVLPVGASLVGDITSPSEYRDFLRDIAHKVRQKKKAKKSGK